MRKIFVLCILSLLSFASCLEMDKQSPSKGGDIQVIGRIRGFDDVNVGTKGSKNGSESEIHNMVLFILDGDTGNTILDKQYEASSKPLFSIDRYADYMDAGKAVNECQLIIVANVTESVKNHLLSGDVTNLAGINDSVLDVDGIDIPSTGIPMVGMYVGQNGVKTIDLSEPDPNNDPLKGSVLEISLECIYAKVVFNIDVWPLQTIQGIDQMFHLDSWQVFNIPDKVKIGAPPSSNETFFSDGNMLEIASRTETSKGDNNIYQSSLEGDYLSFSFYMPEHKVNPKNAAQYPWEPERDAEYEQYKQYLKPSLVQDNTAQIHPSENDKKATYVEIKGRYKDHNNHDTGVTYTIYLGANPVDDFHILRNRQYNNHMTIKGINNSVTATSSWITYDHRVEVEKKQFSLGLQRETLLDSHWEIRPIRIDFNELSPGANSDAVIEIIVPNDCDWIGIESPSESTVNTNSAKYCEVNNTNVAYGKRRYYTTSLNSELNGNKKVTIKRSETTTHTVATISGSPAHTVWVYIDENTSDPTGPQYRYAALRCNYYESESKWDNGNGTPDAYEDYIFRQNNLFPVTYNDNTYYIEYYEEYLYNFDSKEQYGNTSDGMEWGLDGVQLSHSHTAVIFGTPTWAAGSDQPIQNHSGTLLTQIKNKIGTDNDAFYDFYLTRDMASLNNTEGLEVRDHQGLEFTKEIAQYKNLVPLGTNMPATGVIDYCVNRNKRNDDGTIDYQTMKWYTPAIDEIEEICIGGYGEFEVFQDKYYWSSQPAYMKRDARYEGYYTLKNKSGNVVANGNFFADDTYRSRATKCVSVADGSFNHANSGSEFSWGSLTIVHRGEFLGNGNSVTLGENSYDTPQYQDASIVGVPESTIYQEGNQLRTTKNRVRCVYKVTN